MLDTSRQWTKTPRGAKRDHVARYELASKYSQGRVLDAACGCGYGSKILLENAQLVVGVDYSQQAIEWAEEHFHGPCFIQGRIEEEPWSGRFETVVSLETLEHIPNPGDALKAFRRACIGTLIASVPNEERYPFKAEVFARDESPHYRHYRPDEFQELLEGGGFKVLEKYCQVSKQEPEVVRGTDGRYLIYVCS